MRPDAQDKIHRARRHAGGGGRRHLTALENFRKVLFADHKETEQPPSNKRPPFSPSQQAVCLPLRATSGEVSLISLVKFRSFRWPLVLPPAVTLTLSLSVSWSLEQTVAGDAVFSHMRRPKS